MKTFKIGNGLSDPTPDSFSQPHGDCLARGYGSELAKTRPGLLARPHFCSDLVVNIWIRLPRNLTVMQSVVSFKQTLNQN